MSYLLVDTCVLSDIIRQYNPLSPYSALSEGTNLKKNMLRMVNSVICDEDGRNGIIVTSTFAFLELINKFDKIFELEIKERKIFEIDANEIEVMGAGSPADSYASEDIVKFSESEMPDELIGEDEIPF